MVIVDNFFLLGLFLSGGSLGVMLGGFTRHFTDLRVFLPRFFDEYKQDDLTENLKKLDRKLESTAKLIYFSGIFIAIGVFISLISIILDL